MSSDSDYSDSDSGSESGSYSDTGSDSGSDSDDGNCPGGQCGIKNRNSKSCPGGVCAIKSVVSKLKAQKVQTQKKTKASSRQRYSSCSGSDCDSSGSSGSDSESDGFTCYSRDGQCDRGKTKKKGGKGKACDLMKMMDGSLPFDPANIENVILSLSDKFNFRVVMNNEKVKKAAMITTGLSVAGTLIGRHYGGKMGAAVGGAVGGMCGVGLCVVAMRDVWDDIKYRLAQVFDLVYDYLVGMGVKDYRTALKYLTSTNTDTDLAKIVLDVASSTLGKQIMSSLTG